jgi:hypothetical protein
MVFVYFKRAELQHAEYTQHNFWVCLHLAHDAEAKFRVIQKNAIISNKINKVLFFSPMERSTTAPNFFD